MDDEVQMEMKIITSEERSGETQKLKVEEFSRDSINKREREIYEIRIDSPARKNEYYRKS